MRTANPFDLAARSVRSLLSGSSDGRPTWVQDMARPGDAGLFGPGSMVWRVHAYPATLLGGVRALVIQALDPLALAGVLEHSSFRDDPIGRLRNTARFVTVVSFGSTESVAAECAMVCAMHARVNGTLLDGRTYSATDPLLLRHVHLSLVDSFLTAHQLFAPDPLSSREADRYVSEMCSLAPLLGFDSVELPHTTAHLSQLLRPDVFGLEVSDQTRSTLRYLANPPLPLLQRPAYTLLHRAALGTLPAELLSALPPTRPPLLPPFDRAAGFALIRALAAILGPSPALTATRARLAIENRAA